MDMLFWNCDKTYVSHETLAERVSGILETDEWIIDGNYSRTLEMRLIKCDTVFWLNYGLDVCLSGVEARRGMVRPDMPWVETERDESFENYIRTFAAEQIPKIVQLLEKTSGYELHVFRNRTEADVYLRSMV